MTRTRALVHRWLLRHTGPWFKIRWHLASTHRRPTLAVPRVTLQHLAKVLSRKRAAKMAWRWVEASLKHELIVRSDWWTKNETYTVRITHTCPWSPQSALNTVVLFHRMIVKTCVDTLHLVQMLPSLSRTKFRLLLTEMDRSKCRGNCTCGTTIAAKLSVENMLFWSVLGIFYRLRAWLAEISRAKQRYLFQIWQPGHQCHDQPPQCLSFFLQKNSGKEEIKKYNYRIKWNVHNLYLAYAFHLFHAP